MKRILLGCVSLLMCAIPAGCELPPVKEIQQTDGRQDTALGAERRSSGTPTPDDSVHWIEISSGFDTLFKVEQSDSSVLSQEQKCPLPRGTRHSLAAAPEWLGSHVRIQLKKPMAACSFTEGWVYAPHIGRSSDSDMGPVLTTHQSVATLYTTENTAIEGGPKDRCGRPLRTLDDYLNGRAEYVSVAMDRMALQYGTLIRIPEIEKRFNLNFPIPFKIVDTGSAFIGKGLSRLDICVGHNQQTIFSEKYIWMSHKSFDFQVIRKGASFDCG